ncbi:protease modulator HflC [Hwanghaeella sp.]|uniref:protease modulator HflC n=1 Tax=Hwanghaeella sp. TaxID=2605943 RepID=UPI003CCC463D
MKNTSVVVILVLLAVMFVVGSSALFTVNETEQVLVRRFGEPTRVIKEPGLNIKVPFVDTATYFDKRLLNFDGDSQEIPTKDQKQLIVDAFARYRIVDTLRFFQSVGSVAGMEARLPNIINSALRQVLGEVDMSRILTEERAVLMRKSTQVATENSKEFGIEVVDVRMKRVDLPDENSQAVFRRMQTKREEEARDIRAGGDRESRTIRAKADRDQRVILAEARKTAEILRGEGDAQAQAIYNDAYTKDREFFDFWRSMQALERGLGSDSTTYVGPPSGDFFRYFNTESGTRELSRD